MAQDVLAMMRQAMLIAPQRYGDAMVLLLDAQTRARQIGDTCMLVRAIAAEARVALRQRPVESVVARHAESLRIAEASHLAEARFHALFGLARTWSDLSLPDPALHCLEQAVALMGPAFAGELRGWWTFQASVLSQCGRLAEADLLYAGLLELPGQADDPLVYGTTLHNLAAHHQRCGRAGQGLAASEEAERMLHAAGPLDTGTRSDLAACRMQLLVQAGRPDDALALAHAWFESPAPASPWACGLWLATAEAHLALGDPARADEANQRAMDMALRMSIPRTQDILQQAVRIAQRSGHEGWALEMAGRAKAEAERFARLTQSL